MMKIVIADNDLFAEAVSKRLWDLGFGTALMFTSEVCASASEDVIEFFKEYGIEIDDSMKARLCFAVKDFIEENLGRNTWADVVNKMALETESENSHHALIVSCAKDEVGLIKSDLSICVGKEKSPACNIWLDNLYSDFDGFVTLVSDMIRVRLSQENECYVV